ncbi:unnamed protein product [Effrenium voratum]|uniref:non-specific serine/threonine protein kinase n=1 Tax=Effrenium voratum TaxID=2562239 RepID=A0AA36MGJ7_9DINO|nr:unnamed protein product [Effrenium voratum]CAJ1413244.1 unnamed protein product [Effrenium voratum]
MSDAESEESSESGEQPPAVSAAPYEKISCLGEGAFGAVWLARCKSSGRHVALKEVSRQLADPALLVPERDLLRQVAEAREQGSWVSPALTGLVAAFTSAFAVSLAMDLVEGGNLLEHLKAEGRMPAFRVERYGAEIASALKWLHGAGWLYRDLKLSNVMLSLSEESLGRVKLIDYGFAFRGLEASKAVGTLQTMAPEVICCARAAWKEELQLDFLPSSYGPTADWWSLGALLFELLAGVPPFGHHDDVLLEGRQVLEAQLKGPEWPEDVSEAAKGAACGLLRLEPSQRRWEEVSFSEGPGLPVRGDLGFTVESAAAARLRPRRGAALPMALEGPDPFEDW